MPKIVNIVVLFIQDEYYPDVWARAEDLIYMEQ